MKNSHVILLALAVLLALPAFAAGDRYSPAPATIGHARISATSGDVQVIRGATGDHVAARGGLVLAANDELSAGQGSRAEIRLAAGNFLRIGPNSEVKLLDLGDHQYRAEVVRGTAIYSEIGHRESDTEIVAGPAMVRPSKDGVYRITVEPDGVTEVTVRKGEAMVYSDRSPRKLKKGRVMTISSNANGPEESIRKARHEDALDRWAMRRDKMLRPHRRRWAMGPSYYDPWFGYWGYGYGLDYWGAPDYWEPSVVVVGPGYDEGGGEEAEEGEH